MPKILGINFFDGTVEQAIDVISERGGFLIAPSGTCFARLRRDEAYRVAVANADLAIPDSGALVLLWRFLRGGKLNRISGWKYLRTLSAKFFQEKQTQVLWVVASERAREMTMRWLDRNAFSYVSSDFYVAPIYAAAVSDPDLLAKIDKTKPRHIVVGIGSGPQEKLGYYLRENLSYRPAIHCIGAALGFLTGEQVAIPEWADRFYLGWLLRLVSQPRIFLPRLMRAIELPVLLLRYGENLPPLKNKS